MDRYIITLKAEEDLISIWNYTFDEWSEKQADIYYGNLVKSFDDICDDSKSGKNYENIESDLLGCPVGMHIVFFKRYLNGSVEIIRVLHSSMDIKNRIKE